MIELTKEQRRNRMLTMIFGAVAVFFTGFPHVWSIYSQQIMVLTGWSESQSGLCFYLVISFFVFGNIVGGRIQDSSNPLRVLSIGGILQALGVFLSAFMLMENPLPMYLTYGVLHGFGQGMVYAVILPTAQKWFPERKGFATGIVVTANGLCGFFMAPLSRALIGRGGPALGLAVVGILMALAWLLSIIFVKVPTLENDGAFNGAASKVGMTKEYTALEMIKTSKFYLLTLALMLGLISYLVISPISQTLQFSRGVSEAVAVGSVMLGSILNAAARLLLPTLADKIGRAPCVMGVLVVAFGAMVSLCFSTSYGTTLGVILMYGCFGGIMGNFPAFASSIFGLKHAGENYGYVMLGVVGANILSPLITRWVAGGPWDQTLIFIIGAGCALASLAAIVILNKEIKTEQRKSEENEVKHVYCKNETLTR